MMQHDATQTGPWGGVLIECPACARGRGAGWRRPPGAHELMRRRPARGKVLLPFSFYYPIGPLESIFDYGFTSQPDTTGCSWRTVGVAR